MDEKNEKSPGIHMGSEGKYVICPFYSGLKRQCINCQGLDDGYVCTSLRFVNNAKMMQHLHIFCEQKYQYCEVYRMLMEKYDEE